MNERVIYDQELLRSAVNHIAVRRETSVSMKVIVTEKSTVVVIISHLHMNEGEVH